MAAQRRHHLDPGQQVVVERDADLGDRVDDLVGGVRLDVGDEDDGSGGRLVFLLDEPAHPFQIPQGLRELGGAPGVYR